MYWIEKQGVYHSIQSANLNGSDREVIIAESYKGYSSIVVTKDMIFWTDTLNNNLRGLKKDIKGTEKPINIKSFNFDNPRSIYATIDVTQIAECRNVVSEINDSKNAIEKFINAQDSVQCVFGNLINNKCQCELGYSGDRCENNMCLNYCLHGKCSPLPSGNLKCECDKGYSGSRCEIELCNNYCVNGGVCRIDSVNNTEQPACNCLPGFWGKRCEKIHDVDICPFVCDEGEDYKMDKDGKKCR